MRVRMFLLLVCATVLVMIVMYLSTISGNFKPARPMVANSSFTHISQVSKFWTKKTQLCVMFNFPQKEPVIKLLLQYYTCFFDSIMIIFDGKYSKKPDFVPEHVKFSGCESRKGWYHQKCLRICLKEGEQEEGYLYISDDMFINVTLMDSLPRSHAWFVHGAIGNYTDRASWTKDSWWWFKPPQNMLGPVEKVVEALPPKWKQNLVTNIGFPDRFHKRAASDIVYVPKTLAKHLIEVLTFQSSIADMFVETALILAMDIVAPPNKTVHLGDGYLWGNNRNDIMRRKLAMGNTTFVHPIKLSKSNEAKMWKEFMENQLRLYERLDKGRSCPVHEQALKNETKYEH